MNPFGGSSETMSMFSAAWLFSAYASLTALVTLIQQLYYQLLPERLRGYINSKLDELLTSSSSHSSLFTLIIEQFDDSDFSSNNFVYHACEEYLSTKLKFIANRLKASKLLLKDPMSFKLAQGETFSEQFEGIELQWTFICSSKSNETGEKTHTSSRPAGNKYFELSFDPEYKDKVFNSYLSDILKSYHDKMETKKELRLYSYDGSVPNGWRAIVFKHPFTFDSLALEPDFKKMVMDDLDRFMRRKDFYKKVGRAWKRGYLLYGPPGTGKSSLVAAMANHLNFDIFDLQLSSVHDDFMLRRLLLSTTNRSIIVIEDIDCSLGSAVRQRKPAGDEEEEELRYGSQISQSGLLNFIDGLWSSCGDERIIIFTTNHKDKLDPALLRPGRMDMHIHMSYLTMPAFRTLAINYLGVSGEHHLFPEIAELLQAAQVTPAQVAEELIRSEDADVALTALVGMLKKKKIEQKDKEDDDQKTAKVDELQG